MNTHTTTTPPETSANTQRSDGWMGRLVLPLLVGGPLLASIGIGFGLGIELGILAAGFFLLGLSSGITIAETCLKQNVQHDLPRRAGGRGALAARVPACRG